VTDEAARYQREDTIHGLVARWSRTRPDAPAVAGTGVALTYGELEARAQRLAGHLAGRGVGPETRVAVSLPRGPDMVVAFLAVLKAGGTYVPLDPDHPPQRRAFVLEDADVSLVVTDHADGPRWTTSAHRRRPPARSRYDRRTPRTSSTRPARPAGPRGW
jgi:non-ribosomal peptide synthetase component F